MISGLSLIDAAVYYLFLVQFAITYNSILQVTTIFFRGDSREALLELRILS